MAATDFHRALENMGGATYSPHRFDFSVDLNPLVTRLSPLAKYFFCLATEGHERSEGLTVDELYLRRWCDDEELRSEFFRLTAPERVEIVTLYTLPLHETRHHVDFLTTPFGARFYSLLADEYLAFQRCSPFLLQNQDVISPGPVSQLADRLAQVGAAVPDNWATAWGWFRATTERLLAATDTRGLEPDRSRAVRTGEAASRVANMDFYPVSVLGRTLSYSVEKRPNWYMRSSTLLEGRAVIQSLLWIIDSVGVEDQRVNAILGEYLKVNYGRGIPYDYVFLLDLAASWLGDQDFESTLARPTVVVRAVLHNVDNAAWFGLQCGLHEWSDGLRPENLFTRFLFGIKALREGSGSEGPPYAVLEAAETSEDARVSGLVPTKAALRSSLLLLKETQKSFGTIWQEQMSAHFSAVFSVLSGELQRREPEGLRFGSGAPANGNSLSTLDDETYQALFTAYSAGNWVKEWFEFRNTSLFTPSTSKLTLKYLRSQFGLAEVVVNCDCGYLLSQPVPRWRPGTVKITCPGCARQHVIRQSDLTYIALPDEG